MCLENNKRIALIKRIFIVYIVFSFVFTLLFLYINIKAPNYLISTFQNWTKDSGPGALGLVLVIPFLFIIILTLLITILFVSLFTLIGSIVGHIKISKAKSKEDLKHILLFMKKWRRFCIFSKRISKEIVNELKIEENNKIKYLY